MEPSSCLNVSLRFLDYALTLVSNGSLAHVTHQAVGGDICVMVVADLVYLWMMS